MICTNTACVNYSNTQPQSIEYTTQLVQHDIRSPLQHVKHMFISTAAGPNIQYK